MKCFKVISFILLIVFAFNSCKKDEVNAVENAVWVKVFEDTEITATDEELHQGRNGKVITDVSGNIYLYYFSNKLSQTTMLKCTNEGTVIWRKQFGRFAGMDMVALKNGNVILAGGDPLNTINGVKLYTFKTEGNIDSTLVYPLPNSSTQYEDNLCLYAMDDNSVVMSGSALSEGIISSLFRNKSFFIKLNSSFQVEWSKYYWVGNTSGLGGFDEYWTQNSIIPTVNNQFLFQYAVETKPNFSDSNYFQFTTGLLNSDGSLDNFCEAQTGHYFVTQTKKAGVQNRYTDRLLNDGTGGFIFHYSDPEVFGSYPSIPSGFLRIGADAKITDTIPIPLPNGYRITGCNISNGRFLLSAYKSGIVDGTSDFLAERTIFLSGGADLNTNNTFTFQDFYSDFFPSIAPTSDGCFLIMGKIQSFNGSGNKLTLIKYRVP